MEGSGSGTEFESVQITRIRILEAQKHKDPTDPDPAPEHCWWKTTAHAQLSMQHTEHVQYMYFSEKMAHL